MLVSKWGNSLAIRLPQKLVEEMGLAEGDEVEVVAARKRALEIEKADRRAAFLKAMERFRFSLPEGYRFDRDEANER
jgi:antitoxin MazE